MKSTFFTTLVAGLAIVAVGASPAAAQTSCSGNNCTLTHTVSATIPDLMSMSFNSATTTLTAPVIGDFGVDSTATKDNAGAVVLTVKSNRKYQVTLASTTASFSAPLGVTKPAGDLSWTTNGGTSYTAVSATAANLYAATQNSTFGRTLTLGWETKWHFVNDLSGAYSLIMTFTLAGQ